MSKQSVNSNAVIRKLQVGFKTSLPHMTWQAILFLHATAQLHSLMIHRVTAEARFRVGETGSWAGITMRIVASQARDGLAGAKTAAYQKSNGSESHGDGIFQFRLFSHSRQGKPVTPAAHLDLGARRKTSGIDYFPSRLVF